MKFSTLRYIACIVIFGWSTIKASSQQTNVQSDGANVTLPEVMVRNNFDYNSLLRRIKKDTTFYKAFRNLRVLNYTSFNDIKMLNKKGDKVIASLFSKTRQTCRHGCRSMETFEERTSGNLYKSNGSYNYFTPELYSSLFFTKGSICGESNIVRGHEPSTQGKKGLERRKEQLKMLFFSPGERIAGIPFIGNKLDLYDNHAKLIYNYILDIAKYNGVLCYKLRIEPKKDLSFFRKNEIVIDEMETWFDQKTLEVVARNYELSYHAGLYNFDVSMSVEMKRIGDLLVPGILRYKGNWNIIFHKAENGVFTATLYNFSKSN